VLWPFVIAVGLLAALVAGVDVSDGMVPYWALFASALGTQAVGAVLYRVLPSRWPEERRVAVAGLLTLPLFAAEVFLAVVLLTVGLYAFGFAPA
jgi:hypothetical protein